MNKPAILILGKLPPPYIGPAIATEIILKSSLNEHYNLIHTDTKINHNIQEMGMFRVGKIFKSIGIYWKFKQQLKLVKPKLILVPISQTTMGFLKDSIYILLAKQTGAKVIIQLRGSNWKKWLQETPGSVKKYIKYTLKRTEGVIVLGECLKHLFTDYYNEKNIHVVPNGANYTIPAKINTGINKIKLLYLANFLKSKGFKEILEALTLLTKRGITNWELEAAGNWYDSNYENSCKKLIDENSLNVTLHEPKWGADKFQLFANADVFVFTPNEPEGHPWVIVEAMAAGLPIISTNQGAISESVINNSNGFIIEEGNPQSLSEKLEILIKNESMRIEMGKKSEAYYFEKFTEESMVKNLKTTFDLALN